MLPRYALPIAIVASFLFLCAPSYGSENASELRKEDRHLYVDKDTFFASINSFSKVDGAPWFSFKVNAHDELEVHANYGFNDREGGDVGMGIRFLALIEFHDVVSDGIYDESSDKMVSFYPLSASAFESDFLKRTNDWSDVAVDPSAEVIEKGIWDIEFAKAYEAGFIKGWEMGYHHGSRDQGASSAYMPDITNHITEEEMRSLQTGIRADLGSMGYEDEILEWLYRGSLMALHAGFSRGYDSGYHEDDGQDPAADTNAELTSMHKTSSSATRGELTPYAAADTAGLRSDYILPKYRPLKISRQDNGQGGYDQVIVIRDNNNVFGLRCVVSSDYVTIGNGYLSPASMKVDILIDDYPYRGRDTQLALLMEMGSQITYAGNIDIRQMDTSWDQSVGLAQDESELRFSTGNFSGFFSWVKYANADGARVDVKSKMLRSVYGSYWDEQGAHSENHRGVLFTYPRAASIQHDPKIGFIEIEDLNVYTDIPVIQKVGEQLRGDALLYAAASAIVVLFVAATWKRRGPSK